MRSPRTPGSHRAASPLAGERSATFDGHGSADEPLLRCLEALKAQLGKALEKSGAGSSALAVDGGDLARVRRAEEAVRVSLRFERRSGPLLSLASFPAGIRAARARHVILRIIHARSSPAQAAAAVSHFATQADRAAQAAEAASASLSEPAIALASQLISALEKNHALTLLMRAAPAGPGQAEARGRVALHSPYTPAPL